MTSNDCLLKEQRPTDSPFSQSIAVPDNEEYFAGARYANPVC